MDSRVHVLQVISGMGSGGAEMFLMNMYRNMDHNKIVFDFLLQSDENIYKDELKYYGSTVHRVTPYYKNYFANISQLKSVLRNNYPIVHVHANALLYIEPLIYAKKLGVPCRIMHSHNSSMFYKFALPYHSLNKFRIRHYATHQFACSEAAGKWMFGERFTIIPNAIDIDHFSFTNETRTKIRNELGISEHTFVLGQVGRLYSVKNQKFSMEVLKNLLAVRPDSMLVLVGEGGDSEELQVFARQQGISDHVLFLGVRSDVFSILSSFDAFIFPSLYEGLPVTVIEAQANGLPVFCSYAVPEQAVLAKNVHRLSLELGPKKWSEEILNASFNRLNNKSLLEKSGFSIQEEAHKLQSFYLSQSAGGRNYDVFCNHSSI